MTKRWHIALAVLVAAVSLIGGLVVVVRAQSVQGAGRTGDLGARHTRPRHRPGQQSRAPRSRPRTGPDRAADTVHVDDRYRARYAGRYVGWDELLADGRKLPKKTAGCRSDWRATSRDTALNWKKASYLCLDQLTGNGFKPQGVAGSGATHGYRIGRRPAGERNIVVVSSYSSAAEKGLLFPHRPGKTDTTRLTVIDLDRGVYNQVELVRPDGADAFTALDSHGSGFVWVGQYLYSSSLGSLWMYNADDLMEIDGRYVLPAVARWGVKGVGGFSSIGIDRTTKPVTLTAINYTQTGTAWAQSFDLDAAGRIQNGARKPTHELNLGRDFGPGPAGIRSTRSVVVPGTNFQGIGTYRGVPVRQLLLAAGGRPALRRQPGGPAEEQGDRALHHAERERRVGLRRLPARQVRDGDRARSAVPVLDAAGPPDRPRRALTS